MGIHPIKFFFTFSLILSVYHCKGPGGRNYDADKQNSITDTFSTDIPDSKKEPYYQQLKADIEAKLNLSSLQKGFDGVQIRLWYGYAFKNKEQLIVLKESNSSWTAELHTLTYQFNDTYDSILSISKETVEKKPRSGWKNFINNLMDLEIMRLPDYQKIPKYYLGADADAITVEVATRKKYRIFTYPEPSYYKNTISEAEKIVKIMDLVEDEFSYKRLRDF